MNITQFTQIIAIIIVFGIYLIGLLKYLKKSSPNKWNVILVFTTATLLILYLILNYNKIEPKDWAQIFLTFGLVLVTALYAIYTGKQAEASIKMAEEMSKARYDAVRPVLDIERQEPSEMSSKTRVKEVLTDESNIEDIGLSNIICNIGLGPAIDVFSFVQSPTEKTIRHGFGILGVGEKTEPINLSINQQGTKHIVVFYSDIYGRRFESKREVINRENKWILGPLVHTQEGVPK
jgi:Ca2+/Na+ antiporter